MGTRTLKIGSAVTLKQTGEKSTITGIENGKYALGSTGASYYSSDLVGDKTSPTAKPRQGIKKVAAKTAILKDIYRTLGPLWLRHNKLCRARFAGCTFKATEIHHMYCRTGFWLIISKWFFPICKNCHRYATHHSAEAIQAGVSVSRTTDLEYEFNSLERELMAKHGINTPT